MYPSDAEAQDSTTDFFKTLFKIIGKKITIEINLFAQTVSAQAPTKVKHMNYFTKTGAIESRALALGARVVEKGWKTMHLGKGIEGSRKRQDGSKEMGEAWRKTTKSQPQLPCASHRRR